MAFHFLNSIVLITLSTTHGVLFNPTLEWTCGSTVVSVAVRTTTPFQGIAHSRGHISACNVTGDGSLVTKMIIPLWGEGNKCGVRFDQETGLYNVDVEVHEHRKLILEQDRVFHITCDKKFVALKMGDPDGKMLVDSFDDDTNSTEEITPTFEQSPPEKEVEFNLELIPITSNESPLFLESMQSHDVGYGQSYDMKASFKHETDKQIYGERFRITHCTATSDNIVVDLIDNIGCSTDKKIIGNFEYGDGYAVARIPSMFKFPESKTMKLECSLAICQDYQICKPNCDRKLDIPIPEVEEAKMVAKVLGVNDSDIKSLVTDSIEIVNANNGNIASTIVHVLERREVPVKHDKNIGTTEPTECAYSFEVVFLYKVVILLTGLFLLATFINIILCFFYCKKSRKHKDSANRSPGLVKNEFWISDSSLNKRGYQRDDSYVPFNELGRRDSATSYASIKQRIIHPTDLMNNHFPMQENPYRSFKPAIQTVSPALQNVENRNNSTFSVESTSGASTWHESPGRNSHVDPTKESYSIL